jgi:hypothetical protein
MIRKTLQDGCSSAVRCSVGLASCSSAPRSPSYVGDDGVVGAREVVGQIPIELELKRAESLIRQIDPQIDDCKRDLARAEVELEELQESVGAAREGRRPRREEAQGRRPPAQW